MWYYGRHRGFNPLTPIGFQPSWVMSYYIMLYKYDKGDHKKSKVYKIKLGRLFWGVFRSNLNSGLM